MKTIRDFAAAKADGQKIVMVTAYDTWSARLLADSDVDCLLVGDSAMMVMHGERDTLGATVELMAMHTRAVARGAPDKLIITDMPFLAARKGTAHALDAAAELLRAGAHAVKIEGVRGHADVVAHLVQSGIPVMGHLGLLPQSVHAIGGFTVQGRNNDAAARIVEDAHELTAAGTFGIVLECIPLKLAQEITATVPIPTVGIGAGAACDGQVLVLHDLLGFIADFQPKFVRRFVDGAESFQSGIKRFAEAVRAGKFPTAKESYS